MDRLTFEGNFCDITMCNAAVCPCGGSCTQKKVWERLKYYEDAEQDGRLVVLPCKVGDTVYQVDYMTHSEALKSGVPQSQDPYQNRKYGRKRAEYLPLIVREKKMAKSLFREFGKTVFLTSEEAEAALKGVEG